MAFAKEEAELETGHPCKADGGPCSVAKESAIVSGSELRRESVLSVKESWHWLRSNLWVLPLTFTHIWMSAGHSLLQPFFPPLAAAKGIPAWKYGFTFSAIKVSMVFGSIMSEKLIAWTSSKAVYFFGLIGFFLACMSFSLLYWCPTADTLLGGSIAAALFSGFVEGVYLVTLYGTCTSTFLHNTGIIIAIMDCMFGLGSMLGSVIGGALIDLWAFPLPYYVIGALFMSMVPYFIVKGTAPQVRTTGPVSSEDAKVTFSYYRLLINPRFMINMGCLTLTFVMFGFNEPTLEPYVRQFNLSSTGVGTIFMATFASYSVGAIVAGVFCQFKQDAFFEFVGASLATISYLVVGPAPFLPYEPALWLIYLSQVCVGFSCAVLFTCPYYNAYNVALECGYPGTIKTSAFVSSCIFMFQMIGAIITPPLAGYVVEAVGFRNGSMVMFAILLSWLPFTFGLWMDAVRRNKKTPVA
ncbi:MFS-type transporter SLC18B1-like isoform X1 [Amblyomma americanum]